MGTHSPANPSVLVRTLKQTQVSTSSPTCTGKTSSEDEDGSGSKKRQSIKLPGSNTEARLFEAGRWKFFPSALMPAGLPAYCTMHTRPKSRPALAITTSDHGSLPKAHPVVQVVGSAWHPYAKTRDWTRTMIDLLLALKIADFQMISAKRFAAGGDDPQSAQHSDRFLHLPLPPSARQLNHWLPDFPRSIFEPRSWKWPGQ